MKAYQCRLRGTLSVALAMLSTFLCVSATAQSLGKQIVGTWMAVAQYVDQDGKKLEPFGSNPKGMRRIRCKRNALSWCFERGTLPKFASKQPHGGD